MTFSQLGFTLTAVVVALIAGFMLGWRARQSGDTARGSGLSPAEPASPPPAPVAAPAKPPPSQPSTRRRGGGSRTPAGQSPPARPAGDTAALLRRAQSWGYQLQDLNLGRAAASPFDLLVIDYSRDGGHAGALKPAEVARLQTKPDGSRRLVLAYLSIGEAESYRSYWRKDWQRQPPPWLLGENPDWDENYAVCFWDPAWQALLYGSPDAYLDRILAQGFDGVYLDKCDVGDDLKRREKAAARSRPDLDGDMVTLVIGLADYARARRPGFLVVMQNAEPLLERADLRAKIDAVAKEELLYGLDGDETANAKDEIAWSRQRLDLLRREGKPVLAVEYLDDPAKTAKAAQTLRQLGYVPYISDKSRELDRLGGAVEQA